MVDSTVESKVKRQYKYSEETRKKMSEARKGKYAGENHPRYGKTHTEETKLKIRETKEIKNNDLTYGALHKRIKKKFKKPNLCMLCRTNKAIELACITAIYEESLRNWAWFCVHCHRIWDNNGYRRRLKQIQSYK